MSNCPYCGAQGGGASSCGSCNHHKPNSSVNGAYENNYMGTKEKYDRQHGNNSGCFAGETLISTPLGFKPIKSIRRGEYVFSVSACGFRLNRVIQVKRHRPERIWALDLSNGEKIRTTSHHSFKTENGWKKASQIHVRDEVFVRSSTGSMERVSIERSNHISDVEEVFNLIVERDFNFVAGGVIAHSFTTLRFVRCALYTLLISSIGRWGRQNSYASG